MDIEKYLILATLDDRTSEICQEEDGKIYKTSEYSPGDTVPPFHVNWRTTTVPYIEGDVVGAKEERAARDEDVNTVMVPSSMNYDDGKTVYIDKTQSLEHLEQQRYGHNKQTVVNKSYINGGEYRKKFDTVTDNKSVNRVLYSKAKGMLQHRSGTKFEDIYWVNGDTGRIVTSVLDENKDEGIQHRGSVDSKIRGYKNVIVMHTHPGSMPPSIQDFNTYESCKYAAGIVLCHNGKFFSYSSNEHITESLYNAYIAKYLKFGYNDYESQVRTLKKLAINHDIMFKEVISDEKK